MQAHKEPEFKLGLTMAGAISAGAYSAGVFDFLIQALEEWQKAKEGDADSVPNHRVVIPVISGASAGGITAALGIPAVGAMPQSNEATHPRCVLPALYEAWVNRISLTEMLDGRLEGRLLSLLDTTAMEKAAGELLLDALRNFKKPRPYFSRDLHLFLTVTNLRGVPYQIKFRAGSGEVGHVMTMHSDRIHYRLEGFGKSRFRSGWLNSYHDDGIQVTPESLIADDDLRKQFEAAAIGTGAFPIGLPARLIDRQTSDYNSRAWPYRIDKRMELENLWPMWPRRLDGKIDYPVPYAGSDGGLIDNEPFELARWTIMKRPGARNETSAEKADRAVLMIDPFPTPSSFDPDLSAEQLKEQLWLRKIIVSLFPVLKDQARFKAIDLARAGNADVYSRFLIAPSRQITQGGEGGEKDAYEPLASGVLEAFGGFLCPEFPAHDYQLGRRNCQKFLLEHFVLAANNPLFRNWPAKAAQDFQIEKGKFRPIIPLLGSAKPEVELPPWPRIGDDFVDQFMAHVKRRANKLVTKVSREEIGGSLGFVACVGWRLYRRSLLGRVRSRLIADLIRSDQYENEYWKFLQDDVDRLIIAALFDPNPGARTEETIARSINRYCHGRADWSPLTATDVCTRLEGKLVEHVLVSSESGKKVFQIR